MTEDLLVDALSHKPHDPLYHYTTQEGFLKIIDKMELWATHTQYLNDYQEYLHALTLVRQEINLKIKTAIDANNVFLLQEMLKDIIGLENTNVCVCSFSTERDSLSQWRAYGSAASGFAIGFSGPFLYEVAKRENFYLAPCIYEEEKQRKLINSIIQRAIEDYSAQPINREESYSIGNYLCPDLDRYAPIMKCDSFSEEKEWRIYSRPKRCRSERFDFRAGKSMIVPYYRLPLAKKPDHLQITEVVIGPTPHPEQSIRSVESFLVSKKLRNIPV